MLPVWSRISSKGNFLLRTGHPKEPAKRRSVSSNSTQLTKTFSFQPVRHDPTFSRFRYFHSSPSRGLSSTDKPRKDSFPSSIRASFEQAQQELLKTQDSHNQYIPPKSTEEVEYIDETKVKEEVPVDPEAAKAVINASVFKGFPKAESPPSAEEMLKAENMLKQAFALIEGINDFSDVHSITNSARQAQSLFKEALEITGNHCLRGQVAFNFGVSYYITQDWQKAFECFDASIQLDPEFVPAKKYLGDTLQCLGNHLQAIYFYDAYYNDYPAFYSKHIDPNGKLFNYENMDVNSESLFAQVVFRRGMSYYYMKEYGEDFACEDFKAVVRLGGKFKTESLLMLGRLEARRQNYWKAIKFYDIAIKESPKSMEAYKFRSEAWRALGKNDNADQDERIGATLKRERIFEGKLLSKEGSLAPEFNMHDHVTKGSVVVPKK